MIFSMLKKIRSLAGGRERLQPPKEEKFDFLLKDCNLDVGHLWLRDGTWHFEYADAYRNQVNVRPVGSFLRLEEHYESEALWPFFVARIPGMGQPRVQRLIREENLQEPNEIQHMLLERFGERAIVNPYILIPQD